jgi:site-specific DNA-methyltransferase (adenine-specific)
MKPYYEHAGITIYHADCRTLLPLLPRLFADVVIADPPYGDTSLVWDHRVVYWPNVMEGALKPSGSMWVFGSFRYFFESHLDFAHWTLAQDVIWRKQNGSSFHADRFKRVHELAVQFYRGEWSTIFKNPVKEKALEAKRVIRAKRPPHTGHIEKSAYTRERGGEALMQSVIDVPNCHGYAEHPTQKPTGISDPLLRYSCPPNGCVLVPFAGAGSELLQAKRLGLQGIGIEIEEKYCEIAAKRLSQEVLVFAQGNQDIHS